MTRSGSIHANDQNLYFEVHGDGPPLVLVMGIGTTRRCGHWRKSLRCPRCSRW